MLSKEQVRTYAHIMYTAELNRNLKFLGTKSGLELYTDGNVMKKFNIGPL
jgi:hypothetical protein